MIIQHNKYLPLLLGENENVHKLNVKINTFNKKFTIYKIYTCM